MKIFNYGKEFHCLDSAQPLPVCYQHTASDFIQGFYCQSK